MKITTNKEDKVCAVAMKDLVSNEIFHVILCKTKDAAAKYCLETNPKIEYKIIPDWNFVCEAVNKYQKN